MSPLQRRFGLPTDLTPFFCHSVLLIVHLLSFIWAMCPEHFHLVLVTHWTRSVTLVLCLMMVLWILSFSLTCSIFLSMARWLVSSVFTNWMAQFEIFDNLPTASRTVSYTYTQMAKAQLCVNQVRHIEHSSRSPCRVPCGTNRQLSYEDRQSWNHTYPSFYFFGWNHYPENEERKQEYLEKTLDDELQKMSHIKARKFKPRQRLEPGPHHKKKSYVLTTAPRIAPEQHPFTLY